MDPFRLFAYCPRCGIPRGTREAPFRCAGCGFLYYFNPAVAAAAFLLAPDGRGLFIRRAKEPARGKLALAGGFVDIGETAEGGLRREVREEVGLEVENLRFLCSSPNVYLYQGVTYPVLDLFFVATAGAIESARALDGVAGLEWIPPGEVDPGELAFPSLRVALSALLGRPTP
ncbi:MAG TPA: DNA mismatch repair protein MutT [Verrucomicrobiales bacterium]|nr:DNA mismatch repair protein MutT [Verrucomicrobiales bacterium]